MNERVRTTVSIDPEVLEVYRSMADSAGISVSRCLGDWLADTVDGAQVIALKMQEARQAPMRVMREMQAMANGLQLGVAETLEDLRRKSRAGGGAAAGGPAAAGGAPSSDTGLKSPTPGVERLGRGIAKAVKRGPRR